MVLLPQERVGWGVVAPVPTGDFFFFFFGGQII
jgi:hypothetical protein